MVEVDDCQPSVMEQALLEVKRDRLERGKGTACNKGPWLESNQGRCSYVACSVTIQL